MRILPLVFAALPLPAMAEVYTQTSVPTAVTVYSGFAMVTREFTVDVGAGSHEIVLPGLPQWINAASLRVSVEGADIGTTRLRTDALPPQPDADSAAVIAAKAQIKTAERALRDMEDAVQDAELVAEAAKSRLDFLNALSTGDTPSTNPQELADLAQMIETQSLAATRTQLGAQRDARRIAEQRPDLAQAVTDARDTLAALTPPVAQKALLSIFVTAPDAGAVIASVSYPARATWQQTYDVMLTQTGGDLITLRRAALISQNSGENWENVALTLSTLAPSGQVVPSELFPPLLRFADKSERSVSRLSASSLSADLAGSEARAMEAPPVPQPSFDGPGVTYSLPDPITIAQNADDARVELGALDFDARVFARAIPSRDSTAFLMAKATNDSREPLLAADTAQIFVDGALVGRSTFAAVPAGGDIVQAFGPIEDIRLNYALLDRSEGDRGLISRSNARTQEVRMTIENTGAQSWEMEIRDATPYSEQDDLVIQWSAEPRPSETDVDDTRGLIQWNVTLSPQSTQTIMVEQSIRWPDGKVLR